MSTIAIIYNKKEAKKIEKKMNTRDYIMEPNEKFIPLISEAKAFCDKNPEFSLSTIEIGGEQ